MEISVIGAGITGLLSAYYLAKEGHNVTVYEQESYPAMRTSYANGGQLSVSNSEVWTTWANVWKGMKWVLKKDAPLLIRPSLDFDKAKWLVQFLYNTAKNDHEKRTVQTIKMGIESRELYRKIIEEEKLFFDQSNCGILHVYKDKKYFDHAKEIQSLYETNGCEWKILEPSEIFSIEPTLQKSKDIVGGAWTADDWTGDIHKFCVQLEKVLRQKYKVLFFYNTRVYDFDTMVDDVIVISNGIGCIKHAKHLGDKIPVYPVKGYSITIDLENSESLSPKVSLLDDQAKIVTSKLGNRLRVAGTAELDGENYDIRRSRIDPLLNWVKNNFPDLNRKNYSSWAGLRPMTPNMMPIVKQSKRNNIFYHVGHGHLGWTLSPITASGLVTLIHSCYNK